MLALIDADIIVYKSGFAAQHTHYRIYLEGEEEWFSSFPSKRALKEWAEYPLVEDGTFRVEKEVEVEPVQNALYSVKNTIRRIMAKTGATEMKLYLTDGPSNFRIGVAVTAPYKGNRKQEKPVHYEAIRKYLVDVWDAEIIYGEEADDAMAIAQWAAIRDGRDDATCICTIDKDLDQIPGWKYNFAKDISYLVTPHDGAHWFYMQLLMGDKPVDNIIGLDGIGPKRAEKILDGKYHELDMYAAVAVEYLREFGEDKWQTRLLENAHLLWMRSRMGEFWAPPTERVYYDF